MWRRVLVRSRRWLVSGEEDVAEEVRHGLVDVRRGDWSFFAARRRRAPQSASPIARAGLFSVETIFVTLKHLEML
jgi:hypothetical protein